MTPFGVSGDLHCTLIAVVFLLFSDVMYGASPGTESNVDSAQIYTNQFKCFLYQLLPDSSVVCVAQANMEGPDVVLAATQQL